MARGIGARESRYHWAMNLTHLIDSLAAAPATVRTLVNGLDDDELRWKPDARTWSIVEIIGHLYDEEVNDFRPRLQSTLDDPATPWPLNDPEQNVIDGGFQQQDADALLRQFERERQMSIAWLRSLRNPNFETAYNHPRVGPVRAGVLLASWPAHDLLHMRQIIKRRYQYLHRHIGDYETIYAGEWTA